MSNLERDLKNLLSQRAAAAASSPGDWQDLTVRMARRNKRSKRVMAAGLVTALLVGPLAGFGVAQAVDDAEPAGRVTAAGPGVATTEDDAIAARTARLQGEIQAAAGGMYFAVPGQNLEKLFRRTTGDGIVIRAFITNHGAGGGLCQPDGWCPPTDCFPDGNVTGELSTDAAVGFANGMHYGGEAQDLRLTGAGVFGASGEGSPARWVVAQAGDGVETVRVSFEDGGSDEMEPVDGVVLLAALADAEKTGGTVEALDGDGNVVASADAKDAASEAWFSVEPSKVILETQSGSASASAGGESTPSTTMPAHQVAGVAAAPPVPVTPDDRCVPPPPALPEPGEQPADPAAARAEIERAFATAYNGGLGDDEAKRAVVQDSEALKPAMEEILNGTFAQQVKDASARVSEIVFTSPTEAAVRYDINVKDYSNFTGRIGKALLIDGRWKVARVTVCADIGLAGGTCP